VAKCTAEGGKVVEKVNSFAQCTKLRIALIVLTSVCHNSVRFIGMLYDDPMAIYAGKYR